MRQWLRTLVLVICGVAVTAGCGPSDPSPEDGGTPDAGSPPAIVTTSLSDALVGSDYRQALSAESGQAPLTWSVESVPTDLGWLTIHATTGVLQGRTAKVVNPAASFRAVVKDSLGRTGEREFSLRVRACQSGEASVCSFNDGTACMIGSRICTDGQLGDCNGGQAATTVEQCGSGCGPCGPAASRCSDGRCKCGGTGEPCSGAQPTCCATTGTKVCADLESELAHCGACGNDCMSQRPAGTSASCEGGSCVFSCLDGWDHCPKDAAGCVNLNSEESNCGGCGHVCPAEAPANAEYVDSSNTPRPPDQFCQLGQCDLSCKDGFASCDNEIETSGCEEDITTNLNHCGGCNKKCDGKPHATGYSCSNRECRITACDQNWGDCNGSYADGCEVDLTSDEAHCGACGTACSLPNASSVCTNSVCQVVACDPGYYNCTPQAGCEADRPCTEECGEETCHYPKSCGLCLPPRGCPPDDPSCGTPCCIGRL